jgi:hypothetical protein
MKEAYAVRRTVPPSAEIQAEIDKLLSKKLVDDPQNMLGELARLRTTPPRTPPGPPRLALTNGDPDQPTYLHHESVTRA